MKPDYYPWSIFSIFFFPALGGFLFGYDIGAMSFVLTQLTKEYESGVEWYTNVESSSFLQGLITSSVVGGAFLCSLLIFSVSEMMGRKLEMSVAAILFMIGGLLEVLSSVSTFSGGVGISILVIGRYIYGFGCGFATHAAPTYISEMSPSDLRGSLISSKEAMIVLGMVAGYCVGDGFSSTPGGWRYTFLVGPVCAVVYFVGVLRLPDSARWLALQNRLKESEEAVQYVFRDGHSKIMREIKDHLESAQQKSRESPNHASPLQQLFSPKILPATIAGLGVVLCQQITGQPSVLYYAESIFESAGVYSSATIAVGVFKFFCTLLSAFTIDTYGRRRLLFIGTGIMTVALFTIAMYFALSSSQDWIVITAMFLYVGGYQIGFGPVAWLLIAEVFPLQVRGEGMALAVQTNFFFNLLVSLTFSVELSLIGDTASFSLFLVITILSLVFIYYFVPETKSCSLEEIEIMLETGTFSPYQRQQQQEGSEASQLLSTATL